MSFRSPSLFPSFFFLLLPSSRERQGNAGAVEDAVSALPPSLFLSLFLSLSFSGGMGITHESEKLQSGPLFSFSLLPSWRCFSLYLSNSSAPRPRALFLHRGPVHRSCVQLRALCASIIRPVSFPALPCPPNN